MDSAKALESIIKPFSDRMKQFGGDLVSVIVYGSAATMEWAPKQSDVNILVVLESAGIDQLDQVMSLVGGWRKQRVRPLFLTRSYIEASLDSFPLEFLNMRAAYSVVEGADVLEPLSLKKQDLRLQCERELKGKLLHLRQGFVMSGGKPGLLKGLITESIVAFTSIFRGLLFLKDQDMPRTKQEILLNTCREFNMDEGLFSVLLAVKAGKANLSAQQITSNMKRYIGEIEKLSETIDRMEF